jgi:hypothetical protein
VFVLVTSVSVMAMHTAGCHSSLTGVGLELDNPHERHASSRAPCIHEPL